MLQFRVRCISAFRRAICRLRSYCLFGEHCTCTHLSLSYPSQAYSIARILKEGIHSRFFEHFGCEFVLPCFDLHSTKDIFTLTTCRYTVKLVKCMIILKIKAISFQIYLYILGKSLRIIFPQNVGHPKASFSL